MKLLRLKILPIFFCVHQLLLLNSYYIKCYLSFIEVYNQNSNRIKIFDNQKLYAKNFNLINLNGIEIIEKKIKHN